MVHGEINENTLCEYTREFSYWKVTAQLKIDGT